MCALVSCKVGATQVSCACAACSLHHGAHLVDHLEFLLVVRLEHVERDRVVERRWHLRGGAALRQEALGSLQPALLRRCGVDVLEPVAAFQVLDEVLCVACRLLESILEQVPV